MSKTVNSKYNAEIDVLRFVFAVAVIVFHANKFGFSEERFFGLGFIATEFFFMVSGYLMAASAGKYYGRDLGESTYTFIKKKILTLYPYIIPAFIIAFITRYCFSGLPFKEILIKLSLTYPEIFMFKMSGVSSFSYLNGPTWYISAMILTMIVLFPLLVKFKKKFIWIFSPVAVLLIYAYLFRNYTSLNMANKWIGFINVGILRSTAGLCLGCISYGICEKINDLKTELTVLGRTLLIVFELLLLGASFELMYSGYSHEQSENLMYALVFILFILVTVVFSKKTGISNIIPPALSKFLGDFSLAIYLNHRVVIMWYSRNKPDWSVKFTVLVYIVYTVVVSLISLVIIKSIQKHNRKNPGKIKSLFVKKVKE